MQATVIREALLDAMQCVDHGNGTEKRGDVVFLRRNGYALEVSTACWYGAYWTTFQAIIRATRFKGTIAAVRVSLYSFRKAVGRIAKTKGQDVTVEDDGPVLHLRCGNVDAAAEVYETDDDCYAPNRGEGMASVLSRENLQPALDMLAALKPVESNANRLFAQSLAIYAGVAYATDAANLYSVKLRPGCDGFISRAAVERLRAAKKWCDVKLWFWRDGDALYGSADMDNGRARCIMSWTTRLLCSTERDPMDGLVGSMKSLLDGLASAPSWLCDGGKLRQALRECEAFCTRGQSVLFIPCEEGARLLRYDVPDRSTADAWNAVSSADACTTVCEAVWPFPVRIALPRKSLAKIVGKADNVIIQVKDGVAAIKVSGDPVSRVLAEAVCPFEDRTDIF